MKTRVLALLGSATRTRLERFATTFRQTRDRHGNRRALQYATRTIVVKLPRVFAHARAARRAGAVRAEIARARLDRIDGHPHLAVAITGGIGDFIVLARFFRDLHEAAGPFEFDVFAPIPKQALWIFSAVPGFRTAYNDIILDKILGEYDVALRANQMLLVYEDHVRWRALRGSPRLLDVVATAIKARPAIEVFAQNHPWMDNHLARSIVFQGHGRRDYLHRFAGIGYGGDVFGLRADSTAAARHGLRGRDYVTVHNEYDTGFVVSGKRATKCYPRFGAVIAILKQQFPGILFVQLGTTTSEPIAECDVNLLNRTSLEEAAGLIAGARFHLDNESGLVHLASAVGTRCGVVFGPTPAAFFGYPGNINIEPPLCGDCWWMTRTWMDMCAKGYGEPRCMTEQDPATVAARVSPALKSVHALSHGETAAGEGLLDAAC